MQLARAGHPPGLVLNRKSGAVTQLQPDGFPVGFFEESQYELSEASLDPGDVALLFTDGINEAQNRRGECHGAKRLSQALLESLATESAELILRRVLDDFHAFLDLNDDVTMVVVHRVK